MKSLEHKSINHLRFFSDLISSTNQYPFSTPLHLFYRCPWLRPPPALSILRFILPYLPLSNRYETTVIPLLPYLPLLLLRVVRQFAIRVLQLDRVPGQKRALRYGNDTVSIIGYGTYRIVDLKGYDMDWRTLRWRLIVKEDFYCIEKPNNHVNVSS